MEYQQALKSNVYQWLNKHEEAGMWAVKAEGI
jgi:hypothetical protein